MKVRINSKSFSPGKDFYNKEEIDDNDLSQWNLKLNKQSQSVRHKDGKTYSVYEKEIDKGPFWKFTRSVARWVVTIFTFGCATKTIRSLKQQSETGLQRLKIKVLTDEKPAAQQTKIFKSSVTPEAEKPIVQKKYHNFPPILDQISETISFPSIVDIEIKDNDLKKSAGLLELISKEECKSIFMAEDLFMWPKMDDQIVWLKTGLEKEAITHLDERLVDRIKAYDKAIQFIDRYNSSKQRLLVKMSDLELPWEESGLQLIFLTNEELGQLTFEKIVKFSARQYEVLVSRSEKRDIPYNQSDLDIKVDQLNDLKLEDLHRISVNDLNSLLPNFPTNMLRFLTAEQKGGLDISKLTDAQFEYLYIESYPFTLRMLDKPNLEKCIARLDKSKVSHFVSRLKKEQIPFLDFNDEKLAQKGVIEYLKNKNFDFNPWQHLTPDQVEICFNKKLFTESDRHLFTVNQLKNVKFEADNNVNPALAPAPVNVVNPAPVRTILTNNPSPVRVAPAPVKPPKPVIEMDPKRLQRFGIQLQSKPLVGIKNPCDDLKPLNTNVSSNPTLGRIIRLPLALYFKDPAQFVDRDEVSKCDDYIEKLISHYDDIKLRDRLSTLMITEPDLFNEITFDDLLHLPESRLRIALLTQDELENLTFDKIDTFEFSQQQEMLIKRFPKVNQVNFQKNEIEQKGDIKLKEIHSISGKQLNKILPFEKDKIVELFSAAQCAELDFNQLSLNQMAEVKEKITRAEQPNLKEFSAKLAQSKFNSVFFTDAELIKNIDFAEGFWTKNIFEKIFIKTVNFRKVLREEYQHITPEQIDICKNRGFLEESLIAEFNSRNVPQ